MVKMLLDDAEPMAFNDFVTSKYYHDGGWELCKGELVAMSPARPRHEIVVMMLGHLFQSVIGDGPCVVFGPNVALRLWEDNSLVCPDVSVCCDKSIILENGLSKAPELIVEVLSPSTKAYCLNEKREIYRDFGAKEYWVLDVEEKWVLIENFEKGITERFELGEKIRSELFVEFQFSVEDVFKNAM
jgi:Uma2 family endonuclease